MKKFRVIDLFSGAGGLTFGFSFNLINNEFVKRENVKFVFANEYAPYAAESFRKNYPEINMIEGDIQKITKIDIEKYTQGQEVDIIIGGPPCQSFSTIGQRKYDDRAKLSNEYLRILDSVKPKMFLFENVKGILSMREIFYKTTDDGKVALEDVVRHRGKKTIVKKEPIVDHYGDLVMNKLKSEFDRIGYKIVYETKNAYNFGVPQNRERVFIIGIRKDLNLEWTFPQESNVRWTIEDAISDLPIVEENQHKTVYDKEPSNSYQELMRRGSDFITEHYCGIYGDKIKTVIKHVREGQGSVGNDILRATVKIGKPKVKANKPENINVPGMDALGQEIGDNAGNRGSKIGPDSPPTPGPFPGPGPGPEPGPNPGPSPDSVVVPSDAQSTKGAKKGNGSRCITVKELPKRRAFPISVKSGLYKIVILPAKDYNNLFVECTVAGEDGSTDPLKINKFMYQGQTVRCVEDKAGPVQVFKDIPAEFVVTFDRKEKMGLSLILTEGGNL